LIRRTVLGFVLSLMLASYALPQESASKPGTAPEQSEPGIGWKWANFLILAAGLGYLIGKSVPPLFRKQSDEIQAALAEAAKIKREAADYAAAVEARLANLRREIENLRENAHAEMTAEGERLRRETEHHLERIREQSAQELALMTRGAKDELRKFAAELATGLAEQRIRARMNPAVQEKLASGFLEDLNRIAPRMSN
jgi:F-type H+-transporting ATPase subunit b